MKFRGKELRTWYMNASDRYPNGAWIREQKEERGKPFSVVIAPDRPIDEFSSSIWFVAFYWGEEELQRMYHAKHREPFRGTLAEAMDHVDGFLRKVDKAQSFQ